MTYLVSSGVLTHSINQQGVGRGQCDFSARSVSLPQPTKTYLFSTSLTLYWSNRPYLTNGGSWSDLYHFDDFKNFWLIDWLIDWLTDWLIDWGEWRMFEGWGKEEEGNRGSGGGDGRSLEDNASMKVLSNETVVKRCICQCAVHGRMIDTSCDRVWWHICTLYSCVINK